MKAVIVFNRYRSIHIRDRNINALCYEEYDMTRKITGTYIHDEVQKSSDI